MPNPNVDMSLRRIIVYAVVSLLLVAVSGYVLLSLTDQTSSESDLSPLIKDSNDRQQQRLNGEQNGKRK